MIFQLYICAFSDLKKYIYLLNLSFAHAQLVSDYKTILAENLSKVQFLGTSGTCLLQLCLPPELEKASPISPIFFSGFPPNFSDFLPNLDL